MGGQIQGTIATLRVILRTLAKAAVDRARRFARGQGEARPLRIGVDVRPFYEPLTGVGWYLYELLVELGGRPDVELVLFGDARVTDEGPHLHVKLPHGLELSTFDLRGTPLSRLSRPVTAGAYLAWIELEGCDLVFGSNYFLPRLMSAVARRRVVTVHDLTWHHYPELLQKETLDNLEKEMVREIAHSEAVICVSESTRQDLLEAYDIDPSRAVTIHSGVRKLPEPERVEGLPEEYVLFVSTIEPRKNLETLVEAWEILRDRGSWNGALVVAGKVGWKAEPILRRMKESRWHQDIIHLDYLSRPRLIDVYQRASLFAFPSWYEGFGFPLLEAMSLGVPTVAARSSSLPEVGGDATLYFDPADPEGLARQMEQVLSDPGLRSSLIERGRKQVARFDWSRTAEQTLDLFRHVSGKA